MAAQTHNQVHFIHFGGEVPATRLIVIFNGGLHTASWPTISVFSQMITKDQFMAITKVRLFQNLNSTWCVELLCECDSTSVHYSRS
jgi:hypothetical protein